MKPLIWILAFASAITNTANATKHVGHFIGTLDRQEGSKTVPYEVDLFIKESGERTFAVQLERAKDGTNRRNGLVMIVEKIEGGALAFRKVFVDGTSPLPRATRKPLLIGHFEEKPYRGGQSVTVLKMIGKNGNEISYELSPSYDRDQWTRTIVNPKASQRGETLLTRDPYEGELSPQSNRSVNFSLKATSDIVTEPCGVFGGSLQLEEIFPGLHVGRLSDPDLERETGITLNDTLYTFLIPISTSDHIEGYRELNSITFQSEACTHELSPGDPASTRVIPFHNKDFF